MNLAAGAARGTERSRGKALTTRAVLQVVLGTTGRRKGRLALARRKFASCSWGAPPLFAAASPGSFLWQDAERSNETLSGEGVSFGSELTVNRDRVLLARCWSPERFLSGTPMELAAV